MTSERLSVLVNLKFEAYQITNFRRQEHLGIGYIAANARQLGHRVDVINAQFDDIETEKVIETLISMQPQVIGLSLYEMQLQQSFSFFEQIKRALPSTITIAGGHYASFNHHALLTKRPEIDIIVLGEGEYSFPAFLDELENGQKAFQTRGIAYRHDGKIVSNGFSKVVANLDDLPYPLRKDTDRTNFITNISASRGCQANCSFCSTVALDKKQRAKKIRIRDPIKVVEEMAYLVNKNKAHHFFFTDDNFLATELVSKGWIARFSNEIIRRNLNVVFNFDCRVDDITYDHFKLLKAAGLIGVFMGVESNSERTLALYNKKTSIQKNKDAIETLRKLRIAYWIGNIMFHPLSELDDIIADIEFFTDIKYALYFNYSNPVSLLAGRLHVYKGTPIYDELKQQSLIKDQDHVADYEFKNKKVKIFYDFLSLWKEQLEPLVEVDSVHLIDIANRSGRNRLAAQLHFLSRQYMKLDFEVFKDAVYHIQDHEDVDPSVYFESILTHHKAKLDQLFEKLTQVKNELTCPSH